MGAFSFLMMLGLFAVVLYWYILSVIRDDDGRGGLFGIKEADPSLLRLQTKKTVAGKPNRTAEISREKRTGTKTASDIRARVQAAKSRANKG